MKTMLHLFFDITANDGWNGVAIATYTGIAIVIITIIIERENTL